jgi:hypothetical protein
MLDMAKHETASVDIQVLEKTADGKLRAVVLVTNKVSFCRLSKRCHINSLRTYSILKFFQVDKTGRCRMTSSARYFKFGSENYHAAGIKFRVFVGFDHSRQIIHRRVGLRSIPLHGSGLHLRRSAWRGLPGGLPSSPQPLACGCGWGELPVGRGAGRRRWARVTSGFIFPILCYRCPFLTRSRLSVSPRTCPHGPPNCQDNKPPVRIFGIPQRVCGQGTRKPA